MSKVVAFILLYLATSYCVSAAVINPVDGSSVRLRRFENRDNLLKSESSQALEASILSDQVTEVQGITVFNRVTEGGGSDESLYLLKSYVSSLIGGEIVDILKNIDGSWTFILERPMTALDAVWIIRTLRSNSEILYAESWRRPQAVASAASEASNPVSQVLLNRLIVKLKPLLGPQVAKATRIKSLKDAAQTRLGRAVAVERVLFNGAQLLTTLTPPTPEAAQATLDELKSDPDVAYAEFDTIRYPLLIVPNDPFFINQWDFMGAPGGARIQDAWSQTTGSNNIRTAVLDTGAINHPELANRWLGGYDFISNATIARDGNGRDSDPTDVGDWDGAWCNQGSPSSWHGTHVSGTIGAETNNSQGVSGINGVSRILPVRVLGACGGYMSDIADALAWSSGATISGVPNNPNPARVINLSLGGEGPCSALEQSAINQALTNNAVVVVAAGNENANAANYVPANCNGVITVAANGSRGQRAYYSNYGSTIEITAPGGDFQDGSSGGILSTLGVGDTTLTGYSYAYYQGTSMAAPHVAGIVSLMLSRNSTLTPGQVTNLLQNTAQVFPTGTGRDCNTSICGAGIVDAAAVLEMASRQTIQFGSAPSPTFSPSGTFTVSATASSGLPVNFSSLTPSVCTTNGSSTISILTAGSCTISGNQSGDSNWSAAPQVTQNISIEKAGQTISFGPLPSPTYAPNGSFTVSAIANSGLTVTFSSLTPDVCTTSGNSTIAMQSAGNCNIAANQSGNRDWNAAQQVTQSIAISSISAQAPLVAIATPSTILVNQTSTLSTQGGSGSGLITWSLIPGSPCTLSNNVISGTGPGRCFVYAEKAGDETFDMAFSSAVEIPVNQQAGWYPVGSAGFTANNAWPTAMDFDSAGIAYIAYQDASISGNKISVMKFTGSSWTYVGNTGFSANWSHSVDLVIDKVTGNLFVSYIDSTLGDKISVMKYSGSQWVQVGSRGFSSGGVRGPSIAVDPTGIPYVAFQDLANGEKLTVMRFNGSSWESVGGVGISSGAIAVGVSIIIDGTGTPIVAYSDLNNSERGTVAKYDGQSWNLLPGPSTTAVTSGTAYGLSLAIHGENLSSGTLYLSCKDFAVGGASVHKYQSGVWSQLGAQNASGENVSNVTKIAVSSTGIPYILYATTSNRPVVKKYINGAWGLVGNSAFSDGNIGSYDLGLGPDNEPWVAYSDVTRGEKATVMRYTTGIATEIFQSITPSTISLRGQNGQPIVWNSSGFITSNFTGTPSYSITPALPSGLQLNPTTGVITGTPMTSELDDLYTISATNGREIAISILRLIINKGVQNIYFDAVPTPTYSPSGSFSIRAIASSGLPVTISTLTPDICALSVSIGSRGPASGTIIYWSGQEGLEAAPGDAGNLSSWGCLNASISGASFAAIGAGYSNTASIIQACSTSGIAARLADNYSVNGYSDWFLPSKDELNLIYVYRQSIPAILSGYYWSSTQFDHYSAFLQNLTSGTSVNDRKDGGGFSGFGRVRPVRRFSTLVSTLENPSLTTYSAGVCRVSANQAGNDLWNAASQQTLEVSIARAQLSPIITTSSKPYDGTNTAQIIDCTLSPITAGVSCDTTGATASFADANVGTGKTVTVSGLTLTGGNGNYVLSSATATSTANITKASATIALSNLALLYSGSSLSPSATTTPAGLSVTWTGSPQTNAGSYPVTATINEQNYQGSASGTFIINQASQSALILQAGSTALFEASSTTLSAQGGSTVGTVTYSVQATSGLTCAMSGNQLTATGSAGTCTVTATRAGDGNYLPVSSTPLAITVTLPQRQLVVSKTGSGAVYSSPSGISCGSVCSAYYNKYTPVTLTAVPASGQYFVGWGGACSGLGSCTVNMSDNRSVTATFAVIPQNGFSLTVSKTGNGTISSLSPNASINCGINCQSNFAAGQLVTLFAQPDRGHTFMGWSGQAAGICGRQSSCSVYMLANQSISGDFKNTYLLILPAIQLLLE